MTWGTPQSFLRKQFLRGFKVFPLKIYMSFLQGITSEGPTQRLAVNAPGLIICMMPPSRWSATCFDDWWPPFFENYAFLFGRFRSLQLNCCESPSLTIEESHFETLRFAIIHNISIVILPLVRCCSHLMSRAWFHMLRWAQEGDRMCHLKFQEARIMKRQGDDHLVHSWSNPGWHFQQSPYDIGFSCCFLLVFLQIFCSEVHWVLIIIRFWLM